ncbi:2-amino-4-hydroxy-6-hydroxymethyldihydropteridine diphosphokinase [Kingella negevensis]|uniref:2-amino-4-hydroxy-6- hydroxymethyldihydropteridine diphosphokinase n=1 Tax=Kingella negevensis TaxID=1522312 RepID=UPI00254AD4FC|nr:2-amino-4-hydroxy-6-hydroxymethyldihydropteridine diphosphokinase [Kingella negevensis]MDK4683625.1 2-amino-4-hydroxy-6-hydroxymethyldihydropteridine diphosphokinase [Kingella negevensis]MDK4708480.1 2-amino-4-hydroxy-6-hydroxymethyldihydropteridine diphosphokinase [Kingella negevensis]MDK4710859.1 2-amino-4-hydroxy-6-hydroxymethyldihydropteridine diphosphokinase [Kingella negevensis]
MKTVIIALGSNLQNPAEQVRQAIVVLSTQSEICSLKTSSLYCTAPVGYVAQPDFINAVAIAQVSDDCTAEILLTVLHKIEQQFGRERSFRNAPRTLDLDIVDFNHETRDTDILQLPHPRAHQRSFVMKPLAEIAPDYPIGQHGTAQQIAETLSADGIQLFQAA